jgi:thymidylate synthase
MQKIKDIRDKFVELYKNKEFVLDKNGGSVIELIGESFEVDDTHIFMKPNLEYIEREIQWYESQSLNVKDIPGGPPKIWQQVSDKDGFINSNYGWCIYSAQNSYQYKNTLEELKKNTSSRRATMIYNRPNMWMQYNLNGRSDFMCTFATQHFIRNGVLITHVTMRSCDSIFGFRNDASWQWYVTVKLFNDLKEAGIELKDRKIIWTCGSLHVYDKQYYLVDHYIKTGETHITKEEYDKLYIFC